MNSYIIKNEPWLLEVIRLQKKGLPETALDFVYRTIDRCHLDGEFERVDNLINSFTARDMMELTIDPIMGIAILTWPAKDKLKNRKRFVEKFKEWVIATGQMENGLFSGLED